MRIFRHFEDLPDEIRGGAVAIGNFDGLHRGHQAVIGEAGSFARAAGVPWGVLTFEPHPRLLFKPDQPPFRLTPFRVKAHRIEDMGVDYLVVLHFDKDFAARPAESFVHNVLVGALNARHVVSGYDFAFGKGRRGNPEMLLSMGAEEGYDYTCVQPVKDLQGAAFSSTRVREHLQDGDPGGAQELLGRPFEIEGRVETGDKRGRTIGFPTANLPMADYLEPTFGVYAVRVQLEGWAKNKWLDGVANLGRRPTFEGRGVGLEVHIFDFDGDIYGQHLRVALIDFIRPEQKFDGIEALTAQITADSQTARDLLARHYDI